jgi:hypothetical protein
MKRQAAIGFALFALGLGGSCLAAEGQKTVVIHAGQLFDGKSDLLLSNQVIVIQGERIADVGPAGSVRIPAGAEEIDLGSGAIMPGLIDSHNHQFKIGDRPGAGPDAAVPAVIQLGSVFSAGYITVGCEECKARPRSGLYHDARPVERGDVGRGSSQCHQ